MTLNDPYPRFQGHAIFDVEYQWNTNRDLHTPYSTMSFRMTLSDLAKYSMTRIVARSLRQLSFLSTCILLSVRYKNSHLPHTASTRGYWANSEGKVLWDQPDPTRPMRTNGGCDWLGFTGAVVHYCYHPLSGMIFTARCQPSQDVCPSVTRRYSVETAKHVITLFSPSGSHTILVFRAERYSNIPTGTPHPNGVEWGVWKSAICDQYLALSWKRYKIGLELYLQSPTNRKPYIGYHFQWP